MDPKLFSSSIQENHIVVKEKGTINFVDTKTGEGSTIFGFSNESEEWLNQFWLTLSTALRGFKSLLFDAPWLYVRELVSVLKTLAGLDWLWLYWRLSCNSLKMTGKDIIDSLFPPCKVLMRLWRTGVWPRYPNFPIITVGTGNMNLKLAVKRVVILIFVAEAFDCVGILFPTGDAPGLSSLKKSSMNCFFCIFLYIKYPSNSEIFYGFRWGRACLVMYLVMRLVMRNWWLGTSLETLLRTGYWFRRRR